MENTIPQVSKGAQGQKKQKNKGFSKPAQNVQANQQAVSGSVAQSQAQQSQQSKQQAV